MKKIRENKPSNFYQFYPTLASVVAVRSGKKTNAMAVAWHVGLSFDPPLFGILVALKRYTHDLIMKAKEFSVNFMPYEKINIIAGCGRTGGKQLDKFKTFNIKTEKPVKISSPVLKDAYASYECKLKEHHRVGDHTLFVGEIVQVHYSPKAFDKNGLPNLKNIIPALYLGADRYLKAKPVEINIIGRDKVEAMYLKK